MNRTHAAKLALAILLAMVTTACDDVLVVQGEISDTSEVCQLDLFRANSDQSLQFRKIQGDFGTSFTVSPRGGKYYLVLTCPGYRPLKTKAYDVGKDDNLTEIDLGTMKPEKLQE